MYNTGNIVPSAALEDMADNAQTLDALVTKTEGTTTDRLGNTRRVFQQILMDMGFQPLAGSFQTGATITARNQTLYDEVSHVFYAWGGTLPKVVAAGSTPATAGGTGVGAWTDKTDLMLRGELLDSPLLSISGRFALRDFRSLSDFVGADPTGGTSSSSAFAAAIASLPSSGGMVFVPVGTWLIDSSIVTRSGVIICGQGDATKLLVNSDIEVISSNSDITNAIFRAEVRDIFIDKTVDGITTKYDIHFTNPNVCKCIRVRIKSGHDDSQYSATNVGGVFFDKPDGSTQSAFMNKVEDCWVQNNSVYFNNLTDSTIDGGYVWGHVRQFAIRMRNCGNIDVESLSGIITSQYHGGLWIDGSANQIRITGCEWDGNPLLQRGVGIYCPQSSIAVTVNGCTLWGCGKDAMLFTDPVGLSITGNTFWKNNDHDGGYDDIKIIGKAFSPQGNLISSNTFVNDVTRTNRGYAIREVNEGFNPANNIYQGNGVTGSTGYLTPAFKILQQAEVSGNFGLGTENISNRLGNRHTFGGESSGLQLAYASSVAPNGYIDIPVNTDDYIGNPGGFVGTLSVASTRENYAQQSTRYLYSAMAYGTTGSFTQQATQNGSGSGCSITVTMPSNGVIRVTNTSADTVRMRVAFNGVKSLS